MSNCIFCGAELVEGMCPNAELHFKRMCLNCQHCQNNTCVNPDNMAAAKEKIMAAVPPGYEIGELTLKPLELKDATKKCKHWELNEELILGELKK